MDFKINFPDVAGASGAGVMGGDAVEALQKALTAGYGTDVAQLTGGSALRIQSLDKTMKATIQQNEHFVLFNALSKPGAGAVVDEWTERDSIGGFLGGTTNSETGKIPQAQGNYARRVGQVKYLTTRCEISVVVGLGNNIAEPKATEAENGALRLLSDAEYLSFYGNDAVNPYEFSGIFAQIEGGVTAGQVPPENVIDLDGAALDNMQPITQGAQQIAGFGNFGRPTDLFCSQSVQTDLDNSLDPAFRVPLPDVPNGGVALGAPVHGVRTSWGNIKNRPDVFVQDEMQLAPFEVMYPSVAVSNAALKPTIAVDVSQNDAASRFTAGRAGNYYYLVCGLNEKGQSTGAVSAQLAIAAGKKAVITITASAGGQETGYAIYRSRQNGTNAPSDFRLMERIAKAGATTTYTDNARVIPGAVKAALLNMAPGSDNISWRQLLPMTEFALYPTDALVIPWAQALFGYLRITKRKQNVVYKNIVPNKAVWRPFA